MTHWSNRFGITLNVASYLAQAAMILWGPPPVKAAGISWAAFPGADPATYALGYYLARNWGHKDKQPIFEVAFKGYQAMSDRHCDPLEPQWWCPDVSLD